MIRKIIEVDEDKCNGCGRCIPNCPEGALQIIDGKARLVSDLFCDGLGACIGECPEGAIKVVEREAEPYNETRVMEIIAAQGRNTILAHLDHLRRHNEEGYLMEAIAYIKSHNIDMRPEIATPTASSEKSVIAAVSEQTGEMKKPASSGGCPGTQPVDFRTLKEKVPSPATVVTPVTASAVSELSHWPVQLHLVNPMSSHFIGADLLLAADCVAFAMGDFHQRLLRGKTLAIACPKLDSNMEVYIDKLTTLISRAEIASLTVAVMEVPCCNGLLRLVNNAMANSGKKPAIKKVTVGIKGNILKEEWL